MTGDQKMWLKLAIYEMERNQNLQQVIENLTLRVLGTKRLFPNSQRILKTFVQFILNSNLPEIDIESLRSAERLTFQMQNQSQFFSMGLVQIPFQMFKQNDDGRFYINWDDAWSASALKPGDQIADDQLNLSPYWEVEDNIEPAPEGLGDLVEEGMEQEGRVYVKPIGTNPYLTGRGADDRQLYQDDFDVAQGKVEEKALLSKIEYIFESFENEIPISLDSVAYLLLGTVPLHFGPAGAQGGWYRPYEKDHTIGGILDLPQREVIKRDIETIAGLGIQLPQIFLENKDNFDEKLTELFCNYMANKFNYFDYITENLSMTPEEIEERYPEESLLYPSSVQQKRKLLDFALNKDKWIRIFDLEGEDSTDPISVAKFVFSDELRVATRNLKNLVRMAKANPDKFKNLLLKVATHDFSKPGQTISQNSEWNWLNERAIEGLFKIGHPDEAAIAVTQSTPDVNDWVGTDFIRRFNEYSDETKQKVIEFLINGCVDANTFRSVVYHFSRESSDSEIGLLDKAVKQEILDSIISKIKNHQLYQQRDDVKHTLEGNPAKVRGLISDLQQMGIDLSEEI